jgi:hypothetical protein
MCYKKCAVTEFLATKKVRKVLKHLGNIYRSSTVNRSTTGCWAKGVTAYKMGKAELHDWHHWAFLSQLLALRCCEVLMPLFARINISQANNWCTIFQAPNKVSHII